MQPSPIPSTPEPRSWLPRTRMLALVAVAAWPLIMFLEWDRPLLGDFQRRLVVSLLFYFCVALTLRCGWIPFTVIAGTFLGLASDPIVKGGNHETMMWETVRHIVGGTVIGFLVGSILDSISRTRRVPQQHIKAAPD